MDFDRKPQIAKCWYLLWFYKYQTVNVSLFSNCVLRIKKFTGSTTNNILYIIYCTTHGSIGCFF